MKYHGGKGTFVDAKDSNDNSSNKDRNNGDGNSNNAAFGARGTLKQLNNKQQ